MHRTPTFASSVVGRAAGRAAIALVALLAISGCARLGGEGVAGGSAPPPGIGVASSDPVVVFAGRARPGTQERVVMADGQSAQVRVVRSYNAASGRECRELLVGSGMVERPRLVCATGNGGWAEARPLLRGGGAGRS